MVVENRGSDHSSVVSLGPRGTPGWNGVGGESRLCPGPLLLAGSRPVSGRELVALLLSTCDLWPSGLRSCASLSVSLCSGSGRDGRAVAAHSTARLTCRS